LLVSEVTLYGLCSIRSKMGMKSERCRITPLVRNRLPLGTYSKTMPRALWWS
jgi:hypothetical protein